jgi:hypothetical protein
MRASSNASSSDELSSMASVVLLSNLSRQSKSPGPKSLSVLWLFGIAPATATAGKSGDVSIGLRFLTQQKYRPSHAKRRDFFFLVVSTCDASSRADEPSTIGVPLSGQASIASF